ncbi:esterase B1-like [Temnothorax curvispinosus]|uniref:Carboxylic ester hydrolase n=1 Tax=Temnothorax curvispinosus TaxID=300111 RepID=A0A6J1QXF6_9HYME|nr:esterase B1-like [Temnothorax curvispinosus]
MDNSRVEICVHEGKLIGIVEKGVYGDYYTAFRGIPYAKPPIGELRFKDPVPVEPWSDGRDASKHGNIAVQLNEFTRKIEGDEDCLYLNVYATKIESSKKRTVMVWIHGGAFYMGSGDAFFYGPDYIVQKDVVLVTLNYRLGVLGFLNLNNKVATGNQGLKDIIMALQWVQKNISKFGGDPENVTIFGESAGGALVHCLTLSPLAKDISKKDLETINSDFKKAILPRCLATLSKISITIEELKSLYFGDKAVSEETVMNYVDFISDEFFCRGIMEVVDIQTKLNNNDNKTTYLYQFSYESENNPFRKIFKVQTPGVTHTEELAYLFYPYMMKDLGLSPSAVDSEDYKMINCLTQMWTDFAKTGDPTPATNLWLSVTDSQSGKYNYLNIDTNSQIKVFRKGEERWDWEKKKNKLRR